MADIDVQRKGGMGWLWWILGLLLLALIIWWIAAAGDDEAEMAEVVEPAPVVEPTTLPEPVATSPGMTIADILGNPAGFIGQPFSDDEVRVAEVPTDRGFWIEDQGQRLFVVLADRPREEPLDINPGQTVRIEQGILRDPTYIGQIQGAPLDQDTRNLLQGQPIYLVADEGNINILTEGNPQPGTDPAQSAGTPPR
jgi:hypothetical protein